MYSRALFLFLVALVLAAAPAAAQEPGPNPPLPPEEDIEPPAQVTSVRATVGNRMVVVRWQSPADADFQRVLIMRSTVGGADRLVYSGNRQEFTDRGLRNNVLYVYELNSVDRTGNVSESVWVTATPRGSRLFSPRANARLSSAPLLRWTAVRTASYYNVQLYRGSRKVLSSWPRATRLKLRARWTFAGRPQRLVPGVYRWYVWPGLGARSKSRYGAVLGRSSFVIVDRR